MIHVENPSVRLMLRTRLLCAINRAQENCTDDLQQKQQIMVYCLCHQLFCTHARQNCKAAVLHLFLFYDFYCLHNSSQFSHKYGMIFESFATSFPHCTIDIYVQKMQNGPNIWAWKWKMWDDLSVPLPTFSLSVLQFHAFCNFFAHCCTRSY